jgi:hypothetical protein
MKLDEGIAITVFLLLWIDSTRDNIRAVRKHLRGFRLILRELNSKGLGLSPLMFDICRFVFRLGRTASFFHGENLYFPVSQTHSKRIDNCWNFLWRKHQNGQWQTTQRTVSPDPLCIWTQRDELQNSQMGYHWYQKCSKSLYKITPKSVSSIYRLSNF